MNFKTLIPSLFISLFIAGPAWAFEPQDVCSAVGCTPEMKAIADSFVSTQPVQITEGRVYSGVCYYISGSTKPEYAHAGLAVFTPNAEQTEYRGLFSFYGKPSDYAALDYEAALKRVSSTSGNVNVLQNLPKYSGYQRVNGSANLNYWFGMNADQSRMSLLSVWIFDGGLGQVAFCDMQKH
ncbi:MAG: hypothetical protein KF767_14110 [Bdellovibrionaceae bacterium]|nr:hypothetical protein [Pseudobdellovibrionaceae bacterium]